MQALTSVDRTVPRYRIKRLQPRARALQALGYTEREAQFVELAALHSGYFVRRQFNAFVGNGRSCRRRPNRAGSDQTYFLPTTETSRCR